ncbi:MAG: Gfo/Idh/MocA family oxidoreductase [Phycisphaerae bacterium]|nr:Gfo/Idh/MocA family oxidoreductase [Phycisphaerae bacterium]
MSLAEIPVAVIGCGHMGRHHVRKYREMAGARLVAVIDADGERAKKAADEAGVRWATSLTPELGDIAAVSIAVPTVHHLKVAAPLIERGIAVLIEKPLAPTSADAEHIAHLSQKHNTIVQVGHTERFNPAIRAIERMGVAPKFVETHRISPFTFRSADVGVVFDMMIHDIDVVLSLVRDQVTHVDAVGVNVLGPHEDIANARLRFAGGAVATLTASRLALKTERKLRAFSETSYISLDYQKKLGIAVTRDKNADVIKFARERNIEDLSQISAADYVKLVKVEPLMIQDKDALADELETFLDCVRHRRRPPVSAEDGVAAVRVAEQIVDSIKQHRWDGAAGPRVGLDADIFRV